MATADADYIVQKLYEKYSGNGSNPLSHYEAKTVMQTYLSGFSDFLKLKPMEMGELERGIGENVKTIDFNGDQVERKRNYNPNTIDYLVKKGLIKKVKKEGIYYIRPTKELKDAIKEILKESKAA